MGRRERRNEAKRKRRTQYVMGVIIIVVMVLSIGGISVQNQGQNPRFNGVKFTPGEQGYEAKIAGEKVLFYSFPLDGNETDMFYQSAYGLQVHLVSDEMSVEMLQAPFIALTFDPNTTTPEVQFIEFVRFDLGQLMNIPSGVTYAHENYPASTVINCQNQTNQYPIIELITTNQTTGIVNITTQGSCVTVRSDMLSLPTFRDHLILLRQGVFSDE